MTRIIISIVVILLTTACADETRQDETAFLDEVHTQIDKASEAIVAGEITMTASDIAALARATDKDLLEIAYAYCDVSMEDVDTAVTADYGIFLMRRDGNIDAYSEGHFGRLYAQAFFLRAKADQMGLCEAAD